MRAAGRWSLATACRDQRSRPGTGSWPREGSRHTRTGGAGHSTGRGYRHRSALGVSTCYTVIGAHCHRAAGAGLTLMGASSSSRMGCEMKISRALVQRYLISVSSSCTCLPGRLPLTSRSRSMMESRSTSFSAIAGTGYGYQCR